MHIAPLFCLVLATLVACALAHPIATPTPTPGAPLTAYWNQTVSLYGNVSFCVVLPGVGQIGKCGVFPTAFTNDPALQCFSIDSGITVQFTCYNGTYTMLPEQDPATGAFLGFKWYYDPQTYMQWITEAVGHTALTFQGAVLLPGITEYHNTTMPNGKPARPTASQLDDITDGVSHRRGRFGLALATAVHKRDGADLGNYRLAYQYSGMSKDAGACGHGISMDMYVDPASGHPLRWFSSFPTIQPVATNSSGCSVCERLPYIQNAIYDYFSGSNTVDRTVLQLPAEALAATAKYCDLGCHDT